MYIYIHIILYLYTHIHRLSKKIYSTHIQYLVAPSGIWVGRSTLTGPKEILKGQLQNRLPHPQEATKGTSYICLLVLSREWMGMGEWDDYY